MFRFLRGTMTCLSCRPGGCAAHYANAFAGLAAVPASRARIARNSATAVPRTRVAQGGGGNTSTMSPAASLLPAAPGWRQPAATASTSRTRRGGRGGRGALGVNETWLRQALASVPAAIAQLELADAAHGAPDRFPGSYPCTLLLRGKVARTALRAARFTRYVVYVLR
jgi:hypothetical protein